MKKLYLLVDPQIDYYEESDITINNYKPKLPIFGTKKDFYNIKKIINHYDFTDIIVSLNNYSSINISNPNYWTNEYQETPEIFDKITASQIYQEKWFPKKKDLFWYSYDYLDYLYSINKELIILPEFCLENTFGSKIHPELEIQLKKWEIKNNKNIKYIKKESNSSTEIFSIFEDKFTLIDSEKIIEENLLIEEIKDYDFIFISGEILSYNIKHIILDLLRKIEANKIVLLIDTISDLNIFKIESYDFINYLKKQGVILMSTTELIL